MLRFLPLAALAAASLVVTTTSPARASDGEAVVVLVAVAAFDVMALPYDIVMAAKGTRVDKYYARMEALLGGLQAVGGGIGMAVCAGDTKCKSSPILPVLVGFTAWTTAMGLHGALSLDAPASRPTAPAATKPSSFSFVPIVGDGRKTTAGVGVVGRF
jgi:hypothetical protein